MVANQNIVLYRENKTIIAEVFEGERYFIPENVKVFEGTLAEFMEAFPGYSFENEAF